jgi:hypothetical protein
VLPSTAQAQHLLLPTDNRALFDRPTRFSSSSTAISKARKPRPGKAGSLALCVIRAVSAKASRTRDFTKVSTSSRCGGTRKGNPQDEVRAIADGIVAYSTVSPGLSNYGRYIVVKHDWNEGSFYSLYAHLAEPRVAVGQKVKAGTMLGVLGYTGSGIDQRRAHVHVELNLFLSRRFEAWHAASFATPNHHGVFNGLNLIGLDLQALYLAQQKNPAITAAGAVRTTESGYRVAVPGGAEMDIVRNYPWLLDGARPAGKPVSWEVTFSRWGLPLAVKTSNTPVSQPVVTWVKDAGIPHYTHTRGCVTGSGSTGKLTTEGLRFVKLVCGWF